MQGGELEGEVTSGKQKDAKIVIASNGDATRHSVHIFECSPTFH